MARLVAEFNERSFFSRRLTGFCGAIDGGAQVGYHAWPHQLQKVRGGRAWGLLEIIIGAATELFDMQRVVDHHCGRSLGAEHDARSEIMPHVPNDLQTNLD